MTEHSANRSDTFLIAETKYLTIGNFKEGGLYFGLWFKERCGLAWKTVVETCARGTLALSSHLPSYSVHCSIPQNKVICF